ncbi:MAG TPA: MFS transporter [Bryobacteraceae bacterium]|nr:MFS transporter [Bryobacteraceae bacterium]
MSALDPGLEAAVISKLNRRLLPFLFLLYIVAYLDRINVGFAALGMQKELGFNDAVYGLGAGMFFGGYFFFQLPSNLVLARVGARRWMAVLMVVWGAVSAAMLMVRTAHGFYLLRFLLGAAEAGFFPGMILYLKSWFPSHARARAISLFMTAAPLSGVIGGPISGALLNLNGTVGLAGWQWLFLMEALPAVVLGGVVLRFLSDRPEEAQWLPEEHRQWLLEAHARDTKSPNLLTRTNAMAAFASGRVWLLSLVYFGLNTCAYGLALWLPSLIHHLAGFTNFQIGVLSAVPYFVAAVSMALVGHHSDRHAERKWHVALSAAAGAVGLVLTAYSGSPFPVVAGASVAIAGAYAMNGPFWALSSSLLAGTAAAAGVALINSVGNLGGFFGPYVIGLVRSATGTFRGGLLVVSVFLATSGALALLVRTVHVREVAAACEQTG